MPSKIYLTRDDELAAIYFPGEDGAIISIDEGGVESLTIVMVPAEQSNVPWVRQQNTDGTEFLWNVGHLDGVKLLGKAKANAQ